MDKNLLIVTEYFYPRDRPDSYLLTEIAKTLSEVNNGNINIICNAELGDNAELDFAKNKIIRIKENNLNKNRLLSRFLKFIIATMKLSWKTFFAIKRNTHLFTVTNPAFLIIILSLFKKIKNFKYTILVYDVFPENTVAANILNENSILYLLIKKIFDWAYKQADHLIVIGRDMEELIEEKTKRKVPISLITNWCDTEEVIPFSKKDNPIVKQFGLEHKIIFGFIGNFGKVQGIGNLLEMASKITNPKFILLFIGNGAMLPNIKEHIDSNSNKNVVYAGSFPASDKNIFLNSCDISIVSLNDSMYGLGVPSKSYNYMAVAKPILYVGNQNSEIGRVVMENKIGWILKQNDPDSLAKLVNEICSNERIFEELGQRALSVVEKNYSRKVILNKYKKLFNSLNSK